MSMAQCDRCERVYNVKDGEDNTYYWDDAARRIVSICFACKEEDEDERDSTSTSRP